MPQDLSWHDAIQKVLREAEAALHYAEIAERIQASQLRKSLGATPSMTVASMLSTSMSDPRTTPYVRLGRGLYSLKDKWTKPAPLPELKQGSAEAESETGALRAFGMFWRRDQVVWSGSAKLLGRQGLGATDVNFAEQVGVYLLHDRERVIYVGRAADTLFARLKAHTTDRLGGRWDRFSWFGLRDVTADGKLSEPAKAWNHEDVIETLEALLIESLEPPLNRKRGDNLAAGEYLQVPDPALIARRKREMLADIAKAMGVED